MSFSSIPIFSNTYINFDKSVPVFLFNAELSNIACIIALIGLGQYLVAGIYFIIAPFTAHAIANAYWKREDRENNLDLVTVEVEPDYNNPFIHPKDKFGSLETEGSGKLKADDRFSVTALEIDEGE